MIIKRTLDLSLAITGIIVFSPVFIIISILLKLSFHGKVFFIQPRLGYLGNEFLLIKFCTMTNNKDKKGNLLSDEKRLTKFGKFLRKTSIDELPSLINVIKGDMSLVGPRPLLVEYRNLYNERQLRRHTVLPGLTGWAQINGRNNISWEKKFELDIWYVDNRSLFLDLNIIIKTIFKIIHFKDVNKAGFATTEKFKGN